MLSAKKIEKVKRIVNYAFFNNAKKTSLLNEILDGKKPSINRTVKTVSARRGRDTKDDITISLLISGKTTFDSIIEEILSVYPEEKNRYKTDKNGNRILDKNGNPILVITDTTRRRLSYYLKKVKGYNVISEVIDGVTYYSIPSEKGA